MLSIWRTSLLRGSFYKNNTEGKWVEILSDYQDVFDRIDVRPPQMIVGVSVTHQKESQRFPEGAWAFPAILDTGFNRTLEIDERHLKRWTSLDKSYLTPVPPRKNRPPDPRYTDYFATTWLHRAPYVDPRSDQYGAPFHMSQTGIIRVMNAVDEEPFPRLPLLGLQALASNNLNLKIDGRSGNFRIY